MNAPVTDKELENGFASLGIKTGMMLEVHCSLGSFGHVEGGALTVITALKNAVGKSGAIVMPSFKDSPELPLDEIDKQLGLTLKIKRLKGNEPRSGMGIVSDTFRQMPDVVTGEGQFRVSAWGKDAREHVKSWFTRIIDSGGHALLLGVDIYRMSSMHYAEDELPDDIKERFKPSKQAIEKYPESEWHIEAWDPEAKPWYTIQNLAYEKGFIKDTYIGNAKCMLVEVQNTIGLYKQQLLENPYKLYGINP